MGLEFFPPQILAQQSKSQPFDVQFEDCFSCSLPQARLVLFSPTPYLTLGPPKVPAGCDVHNRTQESSVVSCSKIRFGGGDQSEKQYFHMEVEDQQSGELLQNQTSSKPIFTIR